MSRAVIIVIHDYTFKEKVNFDMKNLIDIFNEDDTFSYSKTSYPTEIVVEFSSIKPIDEVRLLIKKFQTMSKSINYSHEYVDYKIPSKRLNCEYCDEFDPAYYPENEKFPCCDKCLCACSEFTHKGENAPFSKMRVVTTGGINFRVCEDCIDTFKS